MGSEILLFSKSFSLCLLLLLVPAVGLNLDGTLLLSFKYSILSDPLSVLGNWDYNDATPCLWTGVTCADVENSAAMRRVVSLVLPNSKLVGTIAEDLGFIQHLRTLDLSSNFLNGTLPSSLFSASDLQALSLSNNAFSGVLHEFILGPENLKFLNLSDNGFSGNIPQGLIRNLTVVSLKNNYFSGPIPSGIQSVEYLDLSSNFLNGSLPLEFGGMNLQYLNLSSNNISGQVPQEFASRIPPNATIDISFNNLSGQIPESMPLSNQGTASYAGNADLCGKPIKKLCTVPSTLSIPPITSNTSSPAIAAMPLTIDGNTLHNSPGTTAHEAQSRPQHRVKPVAIAGIAVGNLAGIGVLAMVLLFLYQKGKKANGDTKENSISTAANAYIFKKDSDPAVLAKEARSLPSWPCLSITNGEETSEETSSDADDNNISYIDGQHGGQKHQSELFKNERSLLMIDGETELDLETLLKASAYVLSSTTSSSIVYKAVIQDGTAFAVRRIGESNVKSSKEFKNQVKTIAKLRHQNLVQVKGFYCGDDEKLVIYEYVSNGNLATVNYRKSGSSPYNNLPFQARLKIAKGVARGLTFIHEKKHVHGNIKPGNILLTPDMEPIISDFGLQWLIYGTQSHKKNRHLLSRHFGSMRSTLSHHYPDDNQISSTSSYITPVGFVGCTSPYHAPESRENLKPSPKWDVYSFGILLLELLTGKVFLNRELSQWTASSVAEDPTGVLRMADTSLRGDMAGREDAMLEWLKLGFSCASLVAHKRPYMKDALHVLEKIPCSFGH